MRFVLAGLGLLVAMSAYAQEWRTPPPGDATRAALMDALRPHAEWELGAPVEFIVDEIRVSGQFGFAMVRAQRPGGIGIDLYKTPGFARGTLDPESMDHTAIQALYRLSGSTWVAVHHALGATDVWFSWEPLCKEYNAVISDFCF